MKDVMGIGHCGRYCKNFICNEPKLDDLCQGCPCNDEEDREKVKKMSEVRRVEFILEFADSDDYSPCCFCEHKYLSEYCRECPVREDPMSDEVVEEDD